MGGYISDKALHLLGGMKAKICDTCGATLDSYTKRCAARLTESCDGYETIERAIAKAQPGPLVQKLRGA